MQLVRLFKEGRHNCQNCHFFSASQMLNECAVPSEERREPRHPITKHALANSRLQAYLGRPAPVRYFRSGLKSCSPGAITRVLSAKLVVASTGEPISAS